MATKPYFDSFENQKFYLQGVFLRDIARIIDANGGKVVKKVTSGLDYLVTGYDTGNDKAHEQVAKLNKGKATIGTLTEDELLNRLVPAAEVMDSLLQSPEGRDRYAYLMALRNLSHEFRELNLKNGELEGDLQTKFFDCDLSETTLREFRSYEFENCVFDGARFEGEARLGYVRNTSFRKSSGQISAQEIQHCAFDGAQLQAPEFQSVTNCQGTGTRFREAHFPILKDCVFPKADWQELSQRNMRLYVPYTDRPFQWERVELNGANLSRAYMENLRGEQLQLSNSVWKESRVRESDFERCDFSGADFSGALLIDVNFGDSDLRGASFEGAVLLRVNFTQARTDGASFVGARVCDVVLTDPSSVSGWAQRVEDFQTQSNTNALDQVQAERIDSEITLVDGTTMSYQKFPHSAWSNNRSMGARTVKTALEELLFMSYDCGAIVPESLKVKSKKSNLKGKELKALCLAVWYEGLFQVSPSDDVLATREKKKQEKVKAERASKTTKKKELLKLLDGKPKSTKEWNLLHSQAEEVGAFKKSDFAGRNLNGVELRNLDFQESNFSKCKLSRADFRRGRFRKCDFSEAKLTGLKAQGADLRKAKFDGADLSKANLKDASVCGTDLSGAVLDQVNWSDTLFDEETVWPQDHTVSSDMAWVGKGPHPGKLAAVHVEREESGPVDLPTFHANISENVDGSRLKKATKMLQKDSFQLFMEVTSDSVVGVVKSQSDASLVYSCSLNSEGEFACCTQNLNTCGGLRGKLCKHLLVLLMGLANSQEANPDDLNTWVRLSQLQKPNLDRDAMSAILLKYKGAEAGEIDWRPTETVPEDYYLF